MHVSTKDSSKDGKTHLLTSVLEADGPFELVSTDEYLSGSVLGVTRTASGGIEVLTEVRIMPRPEQEALPEPSPDESIQ